MKKTIILILSTLFSFGCAAQQMPLSAVANITLPKDAEKINKKTIAVRSKQLSINSELQNINYDKNLYKIDDMSLGLWDVNASNDDKRTLEDIKSQALELFKLDNTIVVDEAAIKNLNHNQFLVITYHKGTSNYVRFVTKTINHKSLNGIIESKDVDKSKAKTIMDEILKGISFK